MHRVIGILLGALATYVALLILVGTEGDATQKYAIAVVLGAIVALLWPWVIGVILARRVRQRHQEQIDKEVDRRMSQEGK
jgi:branched-subunit amino acid ABC-type transport system permease component